MADAEIVPLTEEQKTQIASELDLALALAGEDVDGEAARSACLALLEREEWANGWPRDRRNGPGRATFMQKLALAVLDEIGKPAPVPQIESVPDKGSWTSEPGAPALDYMPGSGRIVGR